MILKIIDLIVYIILGTIGLMYLLSIQYQISYVDDRFDQILFVLLLASVIRFGFILIQLSKYFSERKGLVLATIAIFVITMSVSIRPASFYGFEELITRTEMDEYIVREIGTQYGFTDLRIMGAVL